MVNLSKTSDRFLALACFVFFLSLYGFTSRASVVSSDEVAMFGTSINIVTQHTLHIDNLMEVNRITNLGEKGVGKHLYAKYFPGNILSAAVIYRLGAKANDFPYIWHNPRYGSFEMAPSEQGARIALRLNALLGAMGLTVLLLLLTKHFHWKTALATVLLMGLTTDWWYESRLFFSEIGAGTFLITSFYFADTKKPYLSSLCFAISILFRPTNLLALPIWFYAVRKDKPKSLLSGGFLLMGLGFMALYNYVRFHSLTNFGYGEEGFTTSLFEGLIGVLLSPGHSLFIYSPIIVLAIAGSFLLYKQNRILTLLVLFCVIGYIFAAASWHSWFGGKVWGNRLIVPILPMLGILVAVVVQRWFEFPSRRVLIPILLLGFLGLSIQIITIIQNPMITITKYVDSGYATQTETIWSLDKNWLALEFKGLAEWNACNIDSYSIRMLFYDCR